MMPALSSWVAVRSLKAKGGFEQRSHPFSLHIARRASLLGPEAAFQPFISCPNATMLWLLSGVPAHEISEWLSMNSDMAEDVAVRGGEDPLWIEYELTPFSLLSDHRHLTLISISSNLAT